MIEIPGADSTNTRIKLEWAVKSLNESADIAIKLYHEKATDDFIFMMKDERTYARMVFFKADLAVAIMMADDPMLFYDKMTGLIMEANTDCPHEEIAEEFSDDGEGYVYYCTNCGTEMIRGKDGKFFVRRN